MACSCKNRTGKFVYIPEGGDITQGVRFSSKVAAESYKERKGGVGTITPVVTG